jgi:hypothetical protein
MAEATRVDGAARGEGVVGRLSVLDRFLPIGRGVFVQNMTWSIAS